METSSQTSSQAEKPTVAFALSLAGGVITLLAAVYILFVVYSVQYYYGYYSPYTTGVAGLFYGFGFLGFVWGAMMLIGAIMLFTKPQQHQLWGAIVLVFSIASWFGTFGGFVVGFVLGLIGGILGLVWNPAKAKPAFALPPPPPP